MVSHSHRHTHRHSDSGDVMLFVVLGQDSTSSRLDRQLLFVSKEHGLPCSHIRSYRT